MPFLKDENISRLLKAKVIKDFQSSIFTMSQSTAEWCLGRLNIFSNFLNKEFDGLTIYSLVKKIKEGTLVPYSILSQHYSYLINCAISTITIKQRVVTVKNFFE